MELFEMFISIAHALLLLFWLILFKGWTKKYGGVRKEIKANDTKYFMVMQCMAETQKDQLMKQQKLEAEVESLRELVQEKGFVK